MTPSQENETEALRSDIDVTRRRMDDTIDALGNRMQPRHLIDEMLGYFRRSDNHGNSRLSTMRDKVSQGAGTAVHAVVDTVKQNPVPALLIGAGIAWMIYSSRSGRSDGSNYETIYDSGYDPSADTGEGMRYDPDAHFDRPLDYPIGTGGASEADWREQGSSKLAGMKGAIGDKAAAAKEKLAQAGESAREKLSAARQRAGEIGSRMKTRTSEMYSSTRQRVATTADQHPLELGLICLAAGALVGLAAPTPNAVNRRLGPTADRLRDRARESGQEMLEKGKRVASAAVSAVKDEAQAQGLTPEGLREKVSAVAERAKEAGRETARSEGLPGSGASGTPTGSSLPPGNQSNSPYNDPTVARPAV